MQFQLKQKIFYEESANRKGIIMKIGIICAMPQEIDLLKKDIKAEQIQKVAGREFHCGKLYGQEVVLVMSRIGKVAAALTASVLIDRFGVEKVIFSGTAGGIAPEMQTGDVVVADYSVQHDMDAEEEPFEIPLIGKSYFPSDEELTARAYDAVKEYLKEEMAKDIPQMYLHKFGIENPKVVIGAIASGDQFIREKQKKDWLYANVKNIKCVEMEGAAVAQVCYEYGIPFAVIRVISDSADGNAELDFGLFINEAACHFTRGTVKALLERC